jgi:hypothetical protein
MKEPRIMGCAGVIGRRRDDQDRSMFLVTVAKAVERTGWRVHAYVFDGQSLPSANRNAGACGHDGSIAMADRRAPHWPAANIMPAADYLRTIQDFPPDPFR